MAIRKTNVRLSRHDKPHEKQKKVVKSVKKSFLRSAYRDKQMARNRPNTNLSLKRSVDHVDINTEVKIADICDMMERLSDYSEDATGFPYRKRKHSATDDMGPDRFETLETLTEQLEDEYQKQVTNQDAYAGVIQPLLPIKTKQAGIVSRTAEIVRPSSESKQGLHPYVAEGGTFERTDKSDDITIPLKNNISTTDLVTERVDEIERQKFLIGVTCASILENPEAKIKNLALLLDLVGETTQNGKINMFVIRKLTMVSLVEIFKDIIPEYRLGIIDTGTQKLKKTTMARVSYENELLLQYKKFLVSCERFTQGLRSRGGKNAAEVAEKKEIAVVAIQCMCDLLVAHPYFNYSMNIAQMLVTVLNRDIENVRRIIHSCFVTIFKTDNRYDLSRHIVSHINHVVKKNEHKVHSEMVSCLKFLQIANVNVNAEKEKEIKLKKLESHKSRIINMSRQERKRKKKLAELEKELFETKAEESKQIKQRKLTDLTKLVFTIFFRILKTAPNSKLLSETLEGLSKFAHTINIDFFSDLIEVLNNLLLHANLGYREQLHCIQTVFTVLQGQGEALNIDPARFYSHLYKNLLNVQAGKNDGDLESILSTLSSVFLKRRNNITYHRYLAFIKRIAMMALQQLHFGTLGCLGVIKAGMLVNSSLNILLDTDRTVGSGKYDPTVEEPEFSNANCTSLYELTALCRYYHSIVRKLAINISNGLPSSGPGSLSLELAKLTPLEMYIQYNSSKMMFNPAIPSPKKKQTVSEGIGVYVFADQELEKFCVHNQNNQSSRAFNFLENLTVNEVQI